jgi:predicted Zn finger-like uncharacterized protein
MDIACPTCRAQYDIDDASVGDNGRKVRCASCGTIWRVYRGGLTGETIVPAAPAEVMPPAPEAPLDDALVGKTLKGKTLKGEAFVPETLVESAEEATAQDPPTPRRVKWAKEPKAPKPPSLVRRAVFSTPAGLALITMLTIGAAIHQRVRVVTALPQSAALFSAIGLPVNLRGIAIQNVASRLVEDNGAAILVVDGDLRNVTDKVLDVPRLRMALRDGGGQEIYVWSAQPDRTKLQPGETLNFRRRLASPHAEAKDVSVRFITKADITSGIK